MQNQRKHDGKRKVIVEMDRDMEKVLVALESAGIDPSEAVSQFLAAFEKARKSRSKKNMPRVGV